ncbi:hypothetical protein [Amycolatopsis speibonae]|uniref:Uncharacterized protein n=1 Tax=Amycolatopsis speibonae TaxID=1450224 RepID=A0ABV7P7F3_9PSEU
MRHRDEPTLERERELARIEAALDSATAGEGRAGIGKTRWVQESRALAKGRGFGRLEAVGDALEGAMAWGVIRQLVGIRFRATAGKAAPARPAPRSGRSTPRPPIRARPNSPGRCTRCGGSRPTSRGPGRC